VNAHHFKPLRVEKTSNAPEHCVVPSFEKAQKLREVTKKARIELEPEEIGPSQAPNQHDALAPLPAKRTKREPHLTDSGIRMRKASDVAGCVVREADNERAIAACSSGFGDSKGESPAPGNDSDPRGLPRAFNALLVLNLSRGEGDHAWLRGTQKERSVFARMKATMRWTGASSGNIFSTSSSRSCNVPCWENRSP